MIYKIYEPNLKTLKERLERLNAKLAKIGCPQVTYAQAGHEDVSVEDSPGKFIRLIHLNVEGTAPKFNGWTFLATIDHTPEGNVIRAVPGFEVPDDYRDKAPCCDHCKTNRMRRDTYVVQHQDGRTLQVGSNCMQDFLGYEHPGKLTNAAQLLLSAFDVADAAQDEQWLGAKAPRQLHYYRISLRQYLAHVCAVVRLHKCFVTGKQAMERGGEPTSRIAKSAMDGMSAQLQDYYAPIEADFKLADEAVAWVVSKYSPVLGIEEGTPFDFKVAALNALKGTNNELSDFEHNMLTVARAEAIEPRLCGIAAYVIEAYRRAQPRPAVAQLSADGLSRIFGMFEAAGKSQLVRPTIRLADDAGHYMVLSLAGAASSNAGCIYVKGERGSGNYFGKITPKGQFFPVQTCPTTIEPQLLAFSADPETIAAKYGKLTGRCCFCGRALSDDRSTEVGYGEICAKHMGLRWGEQKAAVAVETVVTA